jgi:23S rRNA pseudouridine2605 synthase
MPLERIQKVLSNRGVLSRRKTEEYIQKGWIKVNGVVVTDLGTKVDSETDIIDLSDEAKSSQDNTSLIMFYKPKGVWSNCPQDNEKECTDYLPDELKHLSTIGRLDKDSEGIILMTDNGVIANQYLNAKVPHKRTYIVKTKTPLSGDQRREIANGVEILNGYMTQPCKVEKVSHYAIKITIEEGKNRQIRRMVETQGTYVTKLKRISFGPYDLEDLEPGQYRLVKPIG